MQLPERSPEEPATDGLLFGTPAAGRWGRPTRMIRDAIHMAPAYLVPGIASLLLVPSLFAILGAAAYGSWALMVALANGVALLISSWPESLTVRFGHQASSGRHGRHSIIALVGCGVAGATGAAILIPTAGAGEIAATSILSVAIGGYLLALAALQAQLRFGRLSRAATTRALAGFGLALGLAVATRSPAACVVGIALGFGAGILDAWRTSRSAQSIAFDNGDDVSTRHSIEYGASSMVNVTGSYILGSADKFILASLRPMAEVGIYAATYTIVDLLFRLLPAIFLVPIRQRVFREWDAGDQYRVRLEILGLATIILWVMTCLLLAVVWAAGLFPKDSISFDLVGPIAAGSVALVVATSISLLYSAEQRQVRLATHVVVAATANIALNLALIPAFGGLGSALACAAGYTLLLILNIIGIQGVKALVGRAVAQTWLFAGLGVLLSVASAIVGLQALAAAGVLLVIALLPLRGVIRSTLVLDDRERSV